MLQVSIHSPDFNSIRCTIVDFIITNFQSPFTKETLHADQSLVESRVIDSYALVELILFLENNWSITITDSDITHENMDSINKIANFIIKKLQT